MGRWTDGMPKPNGTDPRHWLDRALDSLRAALFCEGRTIPDSDYWMLEYVRAAAAEVRAWRKSLPDQGEVMPGTMVGHTDRALIHEAIDCVLGADRDDRRRAGYLRAAEAYLRALGLRLMDRIEP